VDDVLSESCGARPGTASAVRLVQPLLRGGSNPARSGNILEIELNERHLEILEAVGDQGMTPDDLGFRTRLREFDDLRSGGLIVYWPEGTPLPAQVVGRPARSGTWNLTAAGMEARGLPPLRFT